MTKGGGEVSQFHIFYDKGGGGVSQLLTITDKGGGGNGESRPPINLANILCEKARCTCVCYTCGYLPRFSNGVA